MRDWFRLHFRIGGGEFSFFVGWFWVAAVIILMWLVI